MSNYPYKDQHAAFRQEVNHMIHFEHGRFNNIMLPEKYPFISTKEKESYIFGTTLALTQFYDVANNFLEHLIFNYNIDEEHYLKIAHPNGNKPVEDMFAKRKLMNDLSQELDSSNGNKNNKTIKL